MIRSFGMTKQSPSPQHHSPAALRWPPREIQLSWAKVSGMMMTRVAKMSASRARVRNMDPFPFIVRRSDRSSQRIRYVKFPTLSGVLSGGQPRALEAYVLGLRDAFKITAF